MNLENYWQPRPGITKLRRLEQFFSQLVQRNPQYYEVIAIYSSLRNDQYKTMDDFLAVWGRETAWFVTECKVDQTRLGKEIVSRFMKKTLVAKFEIK